ncbi:MAG: restriction endonuclease [Bacteroidales bacterium]|nr:restriction endonuclease [Bacteroidales bacterium]
MARYSAQILAGHFQVCDNGGTNQIRGKAFEDLACYLFETVSGVSIALRNQMNAYNNEEIDVAIWNDKLRHGFDFLPNVILIECKNWSNPVSSIEVNWFCQKVASRGLDFGILIANNGITGDEIDLTAAHNTIAYHLMQKRRIIVITREDINGFNDTKDLIHLVKEKICLLTVAGRIC